MIRQTRAAALLILLSGASACASLADRPGAALPATVALAAPDQANDAYFTAGADRLAALKARVGSETGGRFPSGRAKNVILFVGDGMGVASVTAARIRAGEMAGHDGESHVLAMDAMPHTALSRTYSHDYQVADSAATATAMVTGVKTRSGAINVTSDVAIDDCAAALVHRAQSLFERAELAGMATGVVSTARLTHATPATVYGHAASRDWETDTALPPEAAAAGCLDLASQLVNWPVGDGLELALGGGRANFRPGGAVDPEYADASGARSDGRDLTQAWRERSADHAYVWNAAEFAALNPASGVKVLGLFEPSHMHYELDRADDVGGEPSLAELTRFSIERLAQEPAGYVLMVEGGRIDHAHHAGNAARALGDAIAFDEAVAAALAATSRQDTLVLVTADHSHTLTIAGYPHRGAPILGLATDEDGVPIKAADGKPYTTLGYINGPGSSFPPATPTGPAPGAGPRADLTDVDVQALDYRQQALVPGYSETHAGEDVVIYADGPGAALVAGTLEQNVIYHILADALGL